jgi:hypothetical protein
MGTTTAPEVPQTARPGLLGDAPSVVGNGIRLMALHAPALLTIYLFGQAIRNGALWLAVVLSGVNATLGALFVPFAPLATLSALILMLRVVSPSMRFASFGEPLQADDSEGSEVSAGSANEAPGAGARARSLISSRLALLAGTIVPFLAVYSAQGYLKEDQFKFVNEANADEFLNNADFWLGNGTIDSGRTIVADGFWFWALVIVAFVLRWLIDRLDLPERSTAWGLFAAYVEVTWVALLATGAANNIDAWRGWIERREFVATVLGWWESFTGLFGPIGEPMRAAAAWFWGALGNFDAIIIVPLAWLTVGAVVYGRSLSAPAGRTAFGERWHARTQRLPGPVRKFNDEFLSSSWNRFYGLFRGLRTLAAAGLVPMLLFCLVFVLASQAEVATAEILRRLLGPRDATDALAFSPHIALLTRGVYTVVIVGLLAAAIDRIFERAPIAEPETTSPTVR